MNNNAITVRYVGSDEARRFVLQRGNRLFWTGDGWDRLIGRAKMFAHHKASQKACAVLQHRRHRGKPTRTFTVEIAVTLAAEEVDAIPQGSLVAWLAAALRLDIENTVYGDGPIADSFVKAQIKLNTLTETHGRRRTF